MLRPLRKLIIGILTSKIHQSRADLCRQTWASELSNSPEVEAVFIAGDPSATKVTRSGDLLTVPCPDNYESLPQKVRLFIAWALEQYDFEYLMKCDDDTYVCVPRLIRLLRQEMFGREYVGCLWGRYAQGGAGYLLSRRAGALVAEGLKAKPTGPEDLYVGHLLADHGIQLSDDWRFRADCQSENIPLPGNMIITCHRCRAKEMEQIHHPFMGVMCEPDPGDSLLTLHAWATSYGMLGLGGKLGFPVDGRSTIKSSTLTESLGIAEPRLFSAHASSQLIIEVHRPATLFGFLDDSATDRPNAPVEFIADGRPLGTLCKPGIFTEELDLLPGRHTLEAICTNRRDIGRRYSIWAAFQAE